MERAMRFELTTFCLGSKHSTTELRPLGLSMISRPVFRVNVGWVYRYVSGVFRARPAQGVGGVLVAAQRGLCCRERPGHRIGRCPLSRPFG